MSNEAHPGSDAWIEALDYPPEARAEVSENRRRYLEEAKKFRKESVAWDEGRLAEVFESQLMSCSSVTLT